MKNQTILLIHNFSQNVNGEDIYVSSLQKLLTRQDVTVIPFFRHSNTIPNALRAQAGIAIHLWKNPKVMQELSDTIARYKPDIAHVHNVYPLLSPEIYAVIKQCGVPIVQTVHNYRFVCAQSLLFRNGKICELCVGKRFPYPAIEGNCYRGSKAASVFFVSSLAFHKWQGTFDHIDKFVFPSLFTRQYYIERLGVPVAKTLHISNFADIDFIQKKKLSADPYFLYAGRLTEEKGIRSLLTAAASLPDIRFLIAGTGPLQNMVNDYATRHPNIFFRGFCTREDVYLLMLQALCTVLPSLTYEVQPLTYIESIAHGTPVLVPRFGAFPSFIKEGKTGMYYMQNDADDLRRQLQWIWSHRDSLKGMGPYARSEFDEHYTGDVHYDALRNCYETLADRRMSYEG